MKNKVYFVVVKITHHLSENIIPQKLLHISQKLFDLIFIRISHLILLTLKRGRGLRLHLELRYHLLQSSSRINEKVRLRRF